MSKKIWIGVAILVVAAIGAYLFVKFGTTGQPGSGVISAGTIRIVAAEDFYGNIAAQLGGDKVVVTSILSDPNVDPHEYESSVREGIAVSDANIVIENGLQYDAWMDKLIGASPSPGRIVINAGAVATDPLPENPHVWYGIDNIWAISGAITGALTKIDPADASYFANNRADFIKSLAPITDTMAEIRSQYAGTPVGLTETIYLYQTGPMQLDVLTPLSFERAVAEGNDPSAQDVNTTNQQIARKQVKVLIYNSQTVTPITTNLESAAMANGIPVVPVTETMPASGTYQTWMMSELNALQAALAASH